VEQATISQSSLQDANVLTLERAIAPRNSNQILQLQQFFFVSADADPNRPALVELNDSSRHPTTTTYGTLARQARWLALRLIARSIEPGDRVLMVLPRGGDAIRAQIAILCAGATFVPLDFSTPLDRIVFAAQDARARLTICSAAKAAELAEAGLPVLVLGPPEAATDNETESALLLPLPEEREAIAYIIYTSGTTGTPKGVAVRHRNVCHFVRAEGSVLRLTPDDRVFQSFSYAFDMSIEEIWPALAAGATLVVATEAIAKSGPDIVEAVISANVTVWHAVPTLIGMIERDPPSLRTLNLGGEACAPELVRRWWRPDRRILNTYGPTETTVTATFAELRPGEPLTIGEPLPGYEAFLLDEQLRPVGAEGAGELCIAGEGVGAGYINRPELTAQKFLLADVGAADGRKRLIYRTGDLVRRNSDGRLVFLGRIDDQIKIRGYRVELGEIENGILESQDIREVAVALHKSETAGERLVAHVVPVAGAALDPESLRRRLRAKLPDYMIPAAFELASNLPRLASGKIDRRRLPESRNPVAHQTAADVSPRDTAERDVASACAAALGLASVSVEADFFNDLGGHSLRAAQWVSKLREDRRYARVSMGDIYRCRTVARVAAHLRAADTATGSPSFAAISQWRYGLCVAGQTVALAFLFGLSVTAWVLPLFSYFEASEAAAGPMVALAAAFGAYLSVGLAGAALPILARLLIIGRFRPGAYPLWGLVYFRWWLFRRTLGFAPLGLLAGTPLMAAYLRLLGAKIGRGALIETGGIDIPELIEIGDGATLCARASLSVSAVEAGMLHLGRITIGAGATIGVSACVGRGATIGCNAIVDDLTLIGNDCVVGANETWSGSPGRPIQRARDDVAQSPASPPASVLMRVAFFAAALFIYCLPLLAAFPGLALVVSLTRSSDPINWIWWSPALAVSFALSLAGIVAATKWLVLGKLSPRSSPYWSLFHLRLWIVQAACGTALVMLYPIYGSLYLRPFYRLLGMRFGRGAEMTTASGMAHDLVAIGDHSFVADHALLGSPKFTAGTLTVDHTTIGRRSFVGNCAVVPVRSALADDTLVGVLSRPPASRAEQAATGKSWFGSPAIFLPKRQEAPAFDRSVIFDPPTRLVVQRLVIETIRIVVPMTTAAILSIALTAFFLHAFRAGWSFFAMVALSPVAGLAAGLAAFALVATVKWSVIGRYRARVAPLWSRYVWLTELTTIFYEYLAAPLHLQRLRGTPFIASFLRLLGVKIGRRTFIDTVDLTEFDLVSIGDDAALNDNCGAQTHLFEDRVMKLGPVRIGARSTIGAASIVLYDAAVGDDAMLGELSILMKGEVIPAGTSWEGSPAWPAAAPAGARATLASSDASQSPEPLRSLSKNATTTDSSQGAAASFL